MKSIQKWSYVIRIFFQIAFIAIPIIAFWNCGLFSTKSFDLIESLRKSSPSISFPEEIPYATRGLCFMLSMIPGGVIMWGFYHLIKLFKLYEAGYIFTRENIKHIKFSAYAILGWWIAKFFAHSLIILALTIDNPVGERFLSVYLSTEDLPPLVISIIAIIIAQVMDEARKLKEENEYII